MTRELYGFIQFATELQKILKLLPRDCYSSSPYPKAMVDGSRMLLTKATKVKHYTRTSAVS